MDAAFPTQRLLSTQTKLMIFKLPLDIFDTDPYLLTTSLQKTVCSVNGSFELLDPQATANPLYAMRSYFTFLSRTQLVAAGNQPTWSYKYASVSQNLNAITVTYPGMPSFGPFRYILSPRALKLSVNFFLLARFRAPNL